MLFLILLAVLLIPQSIPAIDAWQQQALGWNYLGISMNFILFFGLAAFSGKSFREYGLCLGEWGRHRLFWLAVLAGMILLAKSSDYFSGGGLHFVLPSLSTILFQLVFVALGEELFWRGYIYKKFGFWFAAVGFALLHVIAGLSVSLAYGIQSGLYTFILGLLLGWVRQKTGSVYASAAIHGLYGLANAMIVAGL